VVSLIEVFAHSHNKDIDVGHYPKMFYQWECGLAQWAYGEMAGQFKGRIFCEERVEVLRQVLEMAKKEGRQVKVYYTSRVGNRMKGLRLGILKSPAAIMNGESYQSLNEI
jgi:hypothetical protein